MTHNTQASRIVGAAIAKVADALPYNAPIIYQMRPIQHEKLPTIMGVDSGARLHYDASEVERYGIAYAPTFVCHEHLHLVFQHEVRKQTSELRGEQHRYASVAQFVQALIPAAESWEMFWNACGDFEVNATVDSVGFPWPQGEGWEPMRAESFDLPKGRSAEFYLNTIIDRAEKMAASAQQNGGSNASQDQQGSDNKRSSGQSGSGSQRSKDGAPSQADRAGDEESGSESEGDQEEGGEGASEDDRAGDVDDSDAQRDADPDRSGDDSREAQQGSAEGAGSESDDDSDEPAEHGGSGTGAAGTGGIGHARCGGCAGRNEAWETIDGDDVPERATRDDIELARAQAAQAIAEWTSGSGRGVDPCGALLAWAKSYLKPAKVDWRKLLARQLRGAVTDARARVDYKFGPMSRRRERLVASGVDDAPAMPVLRGPEPRVVCAVDTSGSMGSGKGGHRLRTAISEVRGVMRQVHVPFYGIAVDAAVHEAKLIKTDADLVALARGGGGTDMRVGIKHASEMRPTPDVIILLTDGETPWPSIENMPRRSRLVIVVTTEQKRVYDTLPAHIKQCAVYANTEGGE